jgi:hypothetical protein
MIKIRQIFSTDIVQGLENADNPSASNPFLTATASGVVSIISGSTSDSNTVVNSNAETDITTGGYTFTIPANTLVVGDRIRITAFGRWGTSVTKNLQFRLKLNTVQILGTKAITLPINQTNRGVGGTGMAGMDVIMGDSSSTLPLLGDTVAGVTTDAIDTTVANTFNFSVQWSVGAPSAGATITFEEILFEKLRV